MLIFTNLVCVTAVALLAISLTQPSDGDRNRATLVGRACKQRRVDSRQVLVASLAG